MTLELSPLQDDTEEKQLVLAFKQGEALAYGQIYERYAPRVLGLCRRMLGDSHDAEEAAQEVFVRVYQGLGRFNGRYQLGAWITRISTNVCLDHIRSRSRRPSDPAPLEELALDVAEAPVDDEPETFVIRRAESRHVRRTLDRLPPMHRAAIVLRDFEGLSYEEVAIALGITEGQTKALIHRARRNFKRSWMPLEAAQLLLPWKLLDRLKRVDVPAENTSQIVRASGSIADVVSSVSHVATSCSAAFQQCGQFMGERMTALATTVIVGSAAMGGVAAGRATAPWSAAEPVQIVASEPIADAVDATRVKAAPVLRKKLEPALTAPLAPPQAAPTEAPPPPAPSPAGEPGPEPSPSPTPAASPTPQKSPTEEPTSTNKAPTQVTLGFDRAGTIPGAAPTSNTTSIDCTKVDVLQELQAPLWDRDRTYPARLSVKVGGGLANIGLVAIRDGVEHSWNGGSGSVQSSRSGDSLVLSFSGSYSWNGGMRPSEAGLPDYGRFTLRMSIDCTAKRVLTESLLLST